MKARVTRPYGGSRCMQECMLRLWVFFSREDFGIRLTLGRLEVVRNARSHPEPQRHFSIHAATGAPRTSSSRCISGPDTGFVWLDKWNFQLPACTRCTAHRRIPFPGAPITPHGSTPSPPRAQSDGSVEPSATSYRELPRRSRGLPGVFSGAAAGYGGNCFQCYLYGLASWLQQQHSKGLHLKPPAVCTYCLGSACRVDTVYHE